MLTRKIWLYIILITIFITGTLGVPNQSIAVNCQDLLNNNVYRCHVKSDFGSEFEDCFRFTSLGIVSEDFDLNIDGLPWETLACECEAKGSFKKPVFNAGREFHCVNSQFVDPELLLNIAFEGDVVKKGKEIKEGEAVNEFGNSFVYECVIDPACELPPGLSVGDENPYKSGK